MIKVGSHRGNKAACIRVSFHLGFGRGSMHGSMGESPGERPTGSHTCKRSNFSLERENILQRPGLKLTGGAKRSRGPGQISKWQWEARYKERSLPSLPSSPSSPLSWYKALSLPSPAVSVSCQRKRKGVGELVAQRVPPTTTLSAPSLDDPVTPQQHRHDLFLLAATRPSCRG
ncbi:hypothetical protein E2C01_081397 [Portunus trituberculatus]|uniref:Uncharacterized protein n=1 Tax=Portunus trituberculatus TaxID=210409 RepID=A0A5B7IVR5_PORTR|nr:hypothetical protein [Portunus trituberculatus]